METCNMKNEFAKAKPSKAIIINSVVMMNIILYPYLSAMGPNTSEPAIIPIGRIETNLPDAISFNPNFETSDGRMEPNVISMMPNNKRPIHAAIKTFLRLYML